VTCHQPDGKGVENTYPPIAKSEWLNDDERIIKIVLKGLYGELKHEGKTYGPSKNTPPMIGFGPLANDEEIAAVISYVRQSFGNDLDFIKAEDVKRVREQVKDRNIFYMVEDILKEHPLGQKKAAPAEKPAEKKADEKKK
jgi:mono/diheme cytochrome c family protein